MLTVIDLVNLIKTVSVFVDRDTMLDDSDPTTIQLQKDLCEINTHTKVTFAPGGVKCHKYI